MTEHDANWATEGLFVIADAIAHRRGDTHSLVGMAGSVEDFVCPTFAMRRWRDPDDGEVPPNFEFYPAQFWINWNRHAGIQQVANRGKPPGMMWELSVAECIRAVADWTP